ncbi:dTDP-4-dehydrorhamnose 3,5-epimerase family protein [Amycolatopsis sp. NPDC005003]
MWSRELAVEGAIEFTARKYPDDRGFFVSPYQRPAFVEAVGKPLVEVAQTSYSCSRQGVIRGVHFTRTPPGCAKYVYCPKGAILDFVVDLRVGSPTFRRWDSVVLGPEDCRSVYLPVGVGHAFYALEDDSLMTYLLSESYAPEQELGLAVLDADLGLPIPAGPLVMSERDRTAPTLAEAMNAGILPDYQACLALEKQPAGVLDA